MDAPNMIVGIAWYRPDQYALLRALAVDSDSMAETHEERQADVARTMDDLRQRGVTTRKVDVDIRELAAWCEEQGRVLDGAARAAYAAQKVK
jgi:hypothetical protein